MAYEDPNPTAPGQVRLQPLGIVASPTMLELWGTLIQPQGFYQVYIYLMVYFTPVVFLIEMSSIFNIWCPAKAVIIDRMHVMFPGLQALQLWASRFCTDSVVYDIGVSGWVHPSTDIRCVVLCAWPMCVVWVELETTGDGSFPGQQLI